MFDILKLYLTFLPLKTAILLSKSPYETIYLRWASQVKSWRDVSDPSQQARDDMHTLGDKAWMAMALCMLRNMNSSQQAGVSEGRILSTTRHRSDRSAQVQRTGLSDDQNTISKRGPRRAWLSTFSGNKHMRSHIFHNIGTWTTVTRMVRHSRLQGWRES